MLSYLLERIRGGRDDRGATVVEYGLIAALAAAAVIAAVALTGTNLSSLLNDFR